MGWIGGGYIWKENFPQKKGKFAYLTHYTKLYIRFMKELNNFLNYKTLGKVFYNLEADIKSLSHKKKGLTDLTT